jgi:hypothetical protein
MGNNLCSVTYGNNLLIVNSCRFTSREYQHSSQVDAGGKIVYQGTGNTRIFKIGTLEYKASVIEANKVKVLIK